ncbi:MAG TPA: hypothetical protein VNU92_00660 [Edaphobacter sp.]|jgi:hypothetical protein|nr:hypothetical protein [Edaphobacter sp.]
MVRQKNWKWKDLGSVGVPAITDDLGRFRFSGIPAGQYAVKATLPLSQAVIGIGQPSLHLTAGDVLLVYSDGTVREKDVKSVEMKSGEQRDDVEVIFPLSGLHTISGSAVADTKAQIRTAMIGQDGTFRLNYVPDGMTGNDVKVVQELMRHAKVSTTMEVYTHAGMDKKRISQSKAVDVFFNRILNHHGAVSRMCSHTVPPHFAAVPRFCCK